MNVVALLRAEQLRRLWTAVDAFGCLTFAETLADFRKLIRLRETHLVVLNPGAAPDFRRTPLHVHELVTKSGRSVPLILYVSGRDVRAALPLVREGAIDLIVVDVDDAPARLRVILERMLGDVPALVITHLTPALDRLTPPIRAAVPGMFLGQVSVQSAARLATSLGLRERTVQRAVTRAELVPVKSLARVARVARGYALLIDPRADHDVDEVLLERGLALDVRHLTGLSIAHVRSALSNAEFAARLAEAALRISRRERRRGCSPS